MRPSVLAFLAACGRIAFDPLANGDAAEPPPPWAGNFTMSPPALVSELMSADSEVECYVVPDGSQLYFARYGSTSHDIWTAARTSVDAPWANITSLSSINGATSDEGRIATVDELRGYFWSDRAATASSSDILMVKRATPSDPWLSANAKLVSGLDTTLDEYDPWPSADGSRIYFAFDGVSGNLLDIYVADVLGDWSASTPQLLGGLATVYIEDNPSLGEDELFLVFSSERGGSKDLFYARRTDRSLPFDPPTLLPVINDPTTNETEGCITRQGELFFSSDRPAGGGSYDIYRSVFIPL